MKAPFVLGLASLGVLAFACAPRVRGGDAGTVRAARREAPRIESSLKVDVGDGASGVRLAFSVTNAGGGKVEMNFPSGKTHDMVVLDSLGHQVWRWSEGRMFTQLLQNKILRTADTLGFDGRWIHAARGRYVAVATLASNNYPIEQRTAFVVP